MIPLSKPRTQYPIGSFSTPAPPPSSLLLEFLVFIVAIFVSVFPVLGPTCKQEYAVFGFLFLY